MFLEAWQLKISPLLTISLKSHQVFSNHIFPNSVANSSGKYTVSTAKDTKSVVPSVVIDNSWV